MDTLLFLKLTVTPVLVALMSVIARRFGPAMGGIILGLPWMTGPILFFLALEHGDAYLAETARGVLLAVPAIAAYTFAYVLTARYAAWPWCLAAGATAFAVTGGGLSQVSWSSHTIAALGVASLLSARWQIAPPKRSLAGLALPWWDIPARMVATAALVGCITIAANYVGPTLLGVVSSFPVIMTVVTTFSHHRWGTEAAMALLRGIMLSLVGFIMFFWIVAMLAGQLGVAGVFVVATVCGAAFNAVLLLLNRRLG